MNIVLDTMLARVEAFRLHGMNASFHYADDTASGEWRLGDNEKQIAMKIFDANQTFKKQCDR